MFLFIFFPVAYFKEKNINQNSLYPSSPTHGVPAIRAPVLIPACLSLQANPFNLLITSSVTLWSISLQPFSATANSLGHTYSSMLLSWTLSPH